jgi:hypothetical protein
LPTNFLLAISNCEKLVYYVFSFLTAFRWLSSLSCGLSVPLRFYSNIVLMLLNCFPCRRMTCFVLKLRTLELKSMDFIFAILTCCRWMTPSKINLSVFPHFFCSWTVIATQFKDKTARQCRRRYVVSSGKGGIIGCKLFVL